MAVKDLTVRLLGDASQFDAEMRKASNSVTGVGRTMTRQLTPVATGVAVAMTSIGSSWNDARDAVITGTGASGAALDGLMDVTKDVASKVPQDFGQVGTAIAALNTRLGLTDEALADTAEAALNLARVTGEDLDGQIRSVARTIQDWGVDVEDAEEVMDLLYLASQQTGIGVTELGDKLVQFGAPLRQLGFELDEAVAIFAGFEAAGVNTETVMAGLRQALSRMARAGESAPETFRRVVEAIAETGDEAEANRMALELFGSRAGPDMAAAIREGRFSIDDLVASLGNSEGAVSDAAERTLRLSDRFKMLRNRVVSFLGPFGEIGGAVAGAVAAMGPLLLGLGQMMPLLSKLRKAFDLLRVAMLKVPLVAVATGVAAVVGALILFGTNTDRVTEKQQAMADAIRETGSALDGYKQVVGNAIAENGELALALAEAGISLDDIVEAAGEGDESLGALAGKLNETAREMGYSSVEAGTLTSQFGDLVTGLEDAREIAEATDVVLGDFGQTTGETADEVGDLELAALDLDDAFGDLEDATDDVAQALEDEKRALEDATRAANEKKRATDDMVAAQRAAQDATFNHRREQQRFQEQLERSTEALGESEEGSLAYQIALDDAALSAASLADAAVRIAEETATANGEVMSASEKTDVFNSEMLAAAETAEGPLRDAILDYIGSVNDIPEDVLTDIGVLLANDDVEAAEALINETSRTRQSQIDAQAEVAAAEAALNHAARPRSAQITPNVSGAVGPGASLVRKRGGPIPGQRHEAIPVLAHGGEFVLDAETVQRIKDGRPTAGANPGAPSVETAPAAAPVSSGPSDEQWGRLVREMTHAIVAGVRQSGRSY